MEGTCVIVGGGPSLRDFNFSLLEGLDVIVVNQAIFQVPHAKYFVTMDYTWTVKSGIFKKPELGNQYRLHPAIKYFVLAVPEDRLEWVDEQHCVDNKFGISYDLTIFDKVIRPVAYGGLGSSLDEFHYGSDSGFAAVQLAGVLGYSKIYLLGLDFCASGPNTHSHDYYKDYPVHPNFVGKLNEFLIPYPELLQKLREKGTQVFSCSPISKLNKYVLYTRPGNIREI
jgi:hypothetical protein